MYLINELLEASLGSFDVLNYTFGMCFKYLTILCYCVKRTNIFVVGNAKSNDRNDHCIVQNCDEARKHFIDKIVNHYLRHNLTLICLEDLMVLLNENRETCDKFPATKRAILKMFRNQRGLFDMFNFVRCKNCSNINKIDAESIRSSCARCNVVVKTTETNFFVMIPIEQQIIKSIHDNWPSISKFETNRNKNNPTYSDAHDGKILRDVLHQYDESDVNILSLCLNLDGANKHKSNSLSVWPIQLLQNYLPPNIRFLPHNIIVCGLYYHQEKPNCYEYMLPLINELNDLRKRKITMTIGSDEFIFKPVITHCSVDLPAKSLLQATKQYGGYESCTYCDIAGELVVVEKSSQKDNIKGSASAVKNAKQFVRYTEGDQQCILRDEVQTLKTMLEVSSSNRGGAVNGVKGKNIYFYSSYKLGRSFLY